MNNTSSDNSAQTESSSIQTEMIAILAGQACQLLLQLWSVKKDIGLNIRCNHPNGTPCCDTEYNVDSQPGSPITTPGRRQSFSEQEAPDSGRRSRAHSDPTTPRRPSYSQEKPITAEDLLAALL